MSASPSRNETMRAARLHGPGEVRVERVPLPAPEDGPVRLCMRSVGICGSDLHHFREGSTEGEEKAVPFVLGHEIAAEVPAESADRLGVAPGTVVAVDPAHPCGHCEWCRRGHRNLCPHVRFKGVAAHPGGLAEYLVADPEQIVLVPDGFGPDAAALLEPLGVAIHGVDLAKIRPMETVAVLGAGPIGLLLAQVARQAGAGTCYVIDPLAYRTGMADRLVADATATTHQAVADWTGGRGVDVVLEATNASEGFQHAVESARIGGRIVLVGIPAGNTYTLTASQARRKGLTIKMCRRMGDVYPRAVQMVASGRVDVEPLVTHRFPLDYTPEAIALQSRYDDSVIKTVIYQEAGAHAE